MKRRCVTGAVCAALSDSAPAVRDPHRPMVAWVTFPEDAVDLIQGTPARWHSSAGVTREFCGRCGTPLSYRHADHAGWIDLTVCSFDDADSFPPADHIWLEHRLGWMRDLDRLPGFPRTRNG